MTSSVHKNNVRKKFSDCQVRRYHLRAHRKRHANVMCLVGRAQPGWVDSYNQADFHKWTDCPQCSPTNGLISRMGSIFMRKPNKRAETWPFQQRKSAFWPYNSRQTSTVRSFKCISHDCFERTLKSLIRLLQVDLSLNTFSFHVAPITSIR